MSDDALIRLGRSTLEAITGILEMHAPGQVAPGDVTVVSDPFGAKDFVVKPFQA